ncbi:hypothetical protein GOBAR_DD16568 [Gossypium barbadense]|nr:hypothetical protein GOBAR_DD16568 [Gossypium barbadense]
MPAFPNFTKELLYDVEEVEEDEAEADATEPTTIHTTTKEKDQIGPEGEKEKTKSVNIESDQKGEERNPISAPTKPATILIAPPSTVPIPK